MASLGDGHGAHLAALPASLCANVSTAERVLKGILTRSTPTVAPLI